MKSVAESQLGGTARVASTSMAANERVRVRVSLRADSSKNAFFRLIYCSRVSVSTGQSSMATRLSS